MLFVIMANPSPFARTSSMAKWASSGPDTNDRGSLTGFAKQAQREADRNIDNEYGVDRTERTKALSGRFKVGSRVKGAPGAFKIKPGAYGTVTKVEVRAGGAVAYEIKLDGGGTVRALDNELARGSKPGY